MNLIRPISMSLSVRPLSIYDVITQEEPEEPGPRSQDTEIASFYLPKDTTKVIHIARWVVSHWLDIYKLTKLGTVLLVDVCISKMLTSIDNCLSWSQLCEPKNQILN